MKYTNLKYRQSDKSVDRKINNGGFTLIELIISTAISIIVFILAAGLMDFSSGNYKAASEDISLQMEAQLILNQLDDFIMQSTNVKVNGNELIIYQHDRNYKIQITFDPINHSLSYEKTEKTGGIIVSSGKQLFGQYVNSILIEDTGRNEAENTIKITLELQQDHISYSVVDHKVTIRNKIKDVSSFPF
jgi:type II secretory pathway pseudopilin PulG